MPEPKVWTRITCARCGKSGIRKFVRGDYIYKDLDYPCPYCNQESGDGLFGLIIDGIWRDDSREHGE